MGSLTKPRAFNPAGGGSTVFLSNSLLGRVRELVLGRGAAGACFARPPDAVQYGLALLVHQPRE